MAKQSRTSGGRLKEYAKYASMHGVRLVYAPPTGIVRRVIWAVLIVVVLCVVCYTFFTKIQRYYDYPVDYSTEVVAVHEMEFPVVTICNYNRFQKSILESDAALAAIINDIIDVSAPAVNWSDPKVADYKTETIQELATKAGPTVNETFRSCKWQGEKVDCLDVFEVEVSELSVCFSFNNRKLDGNQALKVSGVGQTAGLMVQLDAKQDEYYAMDASAAGFKVVLHHPDVPVAKERGLSVGPGTETHLLVKKQVFERLPEPYGACSETSSDQTNHYPMYSSESCKLECMYQHVQSACGCIPYKVPETNAQTSYCSAQQYVDCSLAEMSRYNMSGCGCPVACDETRFSAIPTFAVLSEVQAQQMSAADPTLTSEKIKSNLLDLYVYYDLLEYVSVEQEKAYKISTLFEELGVTLLLWFGAGVLTLIELVDLLIRLISGPCRN